MIVLQLIYWISVLLIAHSYLLFPALLRILSHGKKVNANCFTDEELPRVTILMSVFNEEQMLPGKLDSITGADYPLEKLTVRVGSDASNDHTDEILRSYQERYPWIIPYFAGERRGKPAMINYLADITVDDYIILTDANVFFEKDTIRGLVKHFKNERIGSVGLNVINRSFKRDGVSIQESAFINREVTIKYMEGLIWGATIGQFGAAYSIRKNLYTPVPEGFSVDDFFITLNVLRKGKQAILDIDVTAYEEVSNLISEEYRRKVRIAMGNFQNLKYFGKELLTPWKGASFAYISHKVIRWIGPLLLISAMLSNILLVNQHIFYRYSLAVMAAGLLLSIIDFFLSKLGIHIVFLRFVRHFVTMNLALLHGLIHNLRGKKKHVWQPTKR